VLLFAATKHDWLDYVAALGGFSGVFIGAVALTVAVSTARQARRAADAAERAASAAELSAKTVERIAAGAGPAPEEAVDAGEVAREEPADDIEMSIEVAPIRGSEVPLPQVLAKVRIVNGGERESDALAYSLFTPRGVTIAHTDPSATRVDFPPVATTREPDGDWLFVGRAMDLPGGVPYITHYVLTFPRQDVYPVKLKASRPGDRRAVHEVRAELDVA
jgi:hypothetical protein